MADIKRKFYRRELGMRDAIGDKLNFTFAKHNRYYGTPARDLDFRTIY